MVYEGQWVDVEIIPCPLELTPGGSADLEIRIKCKANRTTLQYGIVGAPQFVQHHWETKPVSEWAHSDDQITNRLTAQTPRDSDSQWGTHTFYLEVEAESVGNGSDHLKVPIQIAVQQFISWEGKFFENISERAGAYTLELVNKSNTRVTFDVTGAEIGTTEETGQPDYLSFAISPREISLFPGELKQIDVLVNDIHPERRESAKFELIVEPKHEV